MRILLFAEGKHELSGALETLVRRLLPNHELEIDRRPAKDIRKVRVGIGSGFYKKCLSAMIQAERENFECVILLVDHDGEDNRIRELSEAQRWTGGQIKRALGIAIKTFDAWMLADEKAFSAVLGRTIPRQKSPERNPDPKSAFQKLMGFYETRPPQSELYGQIAAKADFEVLESRCPKGFKPFAQRVRQLT